MVPIRIGTDCSGIEAPIQALQQLNIPHRHVFSSDIDKYVIKSIKSNYEPEIIFGDIMNRDIDEVPDMDIYVCGFPCQTFSIAGNREGFDDKRGNVFFKCFEVILKKEPKIFILENVKGLLNHDKGHTFKKIMSELESLENYNVKWKLLNTKDYGIPQSRSRVFIIGFRTDIQEEPFVFPESTEMKKLYNYVDETDNKSRDLPPRISKISYMSKIPKESLFVDFSMYGQTTFPNSDKVCSCICRKSEIWCVSKSRFANCKELLSLQGFSPDFKQVVSDTQLKRQIGNSMSVNVLKELFKSIQQTNKYMITGIDIP
jgi:DNA (cytosine-5)-methyltransferase 1